MDTRLEARKKDFKKTTDDPLRRREDAHIQIRKTAREAHLAKRRINTTLNEGATATTTKPFDVSVEGLNEMFGHIMSDNPSRQFSSAQQIRKLLSVEKNPPIQEVIDIGIVPRLVEFLRDDSRPDMQFETAWALTNIASGTQAQTYAVMNAGAIPVFIRLIDSPRMDIKEQAVWALGNIAGDSPKFRDIVLEAGAMEPVVRELQNKANNRISFIRYATWTLSNFCRGKPEPSYNYIKTALPILRQLLNASDSEVLTDACWAISYLSDSSEEPGSAWISEVINSGVCPKLVDLLGHPSTAVQTPALRAVGNIVTGDDQQTQTMISHGCLPKLKEMLISQRKAIRKEACWAISNITAGNREQIEEVICAGIMPELARLLSATDFDVKREAAWAVANAASGGHVRQVAAVVEAGCLPPLVELLGVHDQRIVNVALEAISNILKTGDTRRDEEHLLENPYVRKFAEVGGFPKLDKLQYLGKSKLQNLACRLLTEYSDTQDFVGSAGGAGEDQFSTTGFGGMS